MKTKTQSTLNLEEPAMIKSPERSNQSYLFSSSARQKAARKAAGPAKDSGSNKLNEMDKKATTAKSRKEAVVEFHINYGWAGLLPHEQ